MKPNTHLHSLYLAFVTIFFILIFVLSEVDAHSNSQTKVYAYITNINDNTVSVIDTATNQVIATIPAGSAPIGVAINPDGRKVYVTDRNTDSVSVIDTTKNTVTATVNVGLDPIGVAVAPDGKSCTWLMKLATQSL